jgi:diguanylate cyclase (GGDEF)-like protein
MPREGAQGTHASGAGRPVSRRRVAPAPLRVLLIAILTAALVAVVGGRDGFWMCVPGVLAAASVADSAAGAAWYAAPVLVIAAAITGSHRGDLPPLWEALIVPGLSVAIVGTVSRRLGHERDEMQHAAFSDPLTGLANRRMLMSMAEYEIARHHRGDARFVVVMLDLDGFKQINDRFGHGAGDTLLCEVAEALRSCLREQDTVARLGGDEFCVIAPETENPRVLADKITEAVGSVSGGHGQLQTSVGLSVFPEDGTTIEKLIRVADDRLMAAKRRRHARPQRQAA